METNEKQFDAVKMMRDVRERLSQIFEKMSFEEEKAYIKKHVNTPATQEANRKRRRA